MLGPKTEYLPNINSPIKIGIISHPDATKHFIIIVFRYIICPEVNNKSCFIDLLSSYFLIVS